MTPIWLFIWSLSKGKLENKLPKTTGHYTPKSTMINNQHEVAQIVGHWLSRYALNDRKKPHMI